MSPYERARFLLLKIFKAKFLVTVSWWIDLLIIIIWLQNLSKKSYGDQNDNLKAQRNGGLIWAIRAGTNLRIVENNKRIINENNIIWVMCASFKFQLYPWDRLSKASVDSFQIISNGSKIQKKVCWQMRL